MPAIGVTGGIGTGKTSFVKALGELLPGAVFFDADEMARELTRSDAQSLVRIRQQFGQQVFHASGELNRAALRAMVFGAPEKRRALEQILHPRIREHWTGEANKHRGSTRFFIADIPLLYETGGERFCDRIVVVACSEETQMQRLMQRTGMEREAAAAIVAAQMPLEEKVKRADHVVWNNGPETGLMEQGRLLVSLWSQIQ
ncbi:MAG: dephospho-CoA kinase [Chthoniobacterales bacterium]|nr:MAG: dephospho-CoA kinase [Chthoniobacterales bacterium]